MSEQTKHTPGPWHIMCSVIGNAATVWLIGRKPPTNNPNSLHDQDIIAAVTAEGTSNRADARVMAASPDLLEALRELSSTIKTLRADGRFKELTNEQTNMLSAWLLASDKAVAKATGGAA